MVSPVLAVACTKFHLPNETNKKDTKFHLLNEINKKHALEGPSFQERCIFEIGMRFYVIFDTVVLEFVSLFMTLP